MGRHQQFCQGHRTNDGGDTHKIQTVPTWDEVNAATIINGSDKSENPNIDALLNEIINDGDSETIPEKAQPPHAVNGVFSSTTSHESGEHEDII